MSECPLCDRLSSPTPPPGGWIHRDDSWAVSAHPGIAVPGWLALQTTRHVATLAELNDGEAASLGGLLREMSRVLQAATGADRTYTYALGEGVRHVHTLLGVPLSPTNSTDRGSRLLTRILTRDPTLEQPQRRDEVCAAIARGVGDTSFP